LKGRKVRSGFSLEGVVGVREIGDKEEWKWLPFFFVILIGFVWLS
jgi:hypothetical protein